jgi:nitrilase
MSKTRKLVLGGREKVKVAIAQISPVYLDRDASLERAVSAIGEAAKNGAELVLFSEVWLSGYPFWTDGWDSNIPAWVGSRVMFRDAAIVVPSEDTDRIGAAARQHNIYVAMGCNEIDPRPESDTIYNTLMFFGRDGTLMGKHRKLMPTASERLIWGFGDGSTLPVFETPLGRLGAVICWENYMPLLRTAMYAKGIQLYCAPTADGRDTWTPTMQHIAVEGRCFVLSCNQFCRRSDYPAEYDTAFGNEPDTIVSRGGSCIVDPFGRLLAGPAYTGECILTADLEMDEIARGKFDLDVVGHYARPDVFQLHVNERPCPPVITTAEPERPRED